MDKWGRSGVRRLFCADVEPCRKWLAQVMSRMLTGRFLAVKRNTIAEVH